jgi:CDP-diacylglycerol--glycerol-3-phosphate 3-phosphatidyltransferase
MIDLRGRDWFGKYLLGPVARALVRIGVSASMVTLAGLAIVVAGSFVLAAGHPVTAAIVIGLGSLVDGIDGTVARLTGTVSRRGMFLDTFSDRVGETAMFAGLAWWLADDRLLVVLTVIGLGLSLLIPYLRGKAEAAGVEGKGGLMGRAERIILFCALIGPVGWGWWGPEVMLWPFVVLTGMTVVQRYWKAWSQLG